MAALLVFLGLIGLGSWQLQRRAWKLDLIARVEARLHAAPAPAPGPAEWPALSATRDEYRRVSLRGHFLPVPPALTQATTALGAGFWVLSPLRDEAGFTVLVNRGFVASGQRSEIVTPVGPQEILGLLRLSEPGGGFLRSNDPAADRWHSRDVAAIAAARGLAGVAPYFVDAEAGPPGTLPVGGLTVTSFRNTHLVYALTWYALALMVAGGTAYAIREEWRVRRSAA
ncbi:SURF1 family protein [Roseomonas sp. KE0001]|uniref:SURF1 family protein n=1 Tax=Roseomonas sp. KE0001 TaxID=2479201 RepID=UPI002104581F|nr:SURF1 family protein [Roseomonas sp. KE0001]